MGADIANQLIVAIFLFVIVMLAKGEYLVQRDSVANCSLHSEIRSVYLIDVCAKMSSSFPALHTASEHDNILTTNKQAQQSNLICQYFGYCKANSDCVAGNKCVTQNQYYSQCVPDPTTYKTANCVSNYQYCTTSSTCCDPGASCSGNQCLQPAAGSGLCQNPTAYSTPSSSPTTALPSTPKTAQPSKPTVTVTSAPTGIPNTEQGNNQLCCATTSYAQSWPSCTSGANVNHPDPTCSTCYAYQCIDWTVGSAGMLAREASFHAETGIPVYFGVGSYGNEPTRAGLCYRITTDSLEQDLIVQVVNQGGDVPNGNFDLQVGDGGFGINDACTMDGTPVPQFGGPGSDWGNRYGGWSDRASCANLPRYPICSEPNPAADNLQDLCTWSFDHGFRPNSGDNPKILNLCEVKCPAELYNATGLRRADEKNSGYTCGSTGNSSGGILTRYMDCAKPSYGFANNVNGPTYPGYHQVIPCRRDGYTRVNSFTAPSPLSTGIPAAAASSPAPSATLTRGPSSAPSKCPSSTVDTPSPAVPPSASSTASPTTSTSQLPTKLPSVTPTHPTTVRPSTAAPSPASNPQSLPICQYSGYCKQSSDCVAGNKCVVFSAYYSQCLPDPTTYLSVNCVANYGQCTASNSKCCDPGAACSSSSYSQCMQPVIGSSQCRNPSGFSFAHRALTAEDQAAAVACSLSSAACSRLNRIGSAKTILSSGEKAYELYMAFYSDEYCERNASIAPMKLAGGDWCSSLGQSGMLSSIESDFPPWKGLVRKELISSNPESVVKMVLEMPFKECRPYSDRSVEQFEFQFAILEECWEVGRVVKARLRLFVASTCRGRFLLVNAKTMGMTYPLYDSNSSTFFYHSCL